MEKQQTGVEWFASEIRNHIEMPSRHFEELLEQAKQMEKEHTCKFTNDYVETQCSASFDGSISVEMSTDEYYKQTFKSK